MDRVHTLRMLKMVEVSIKTIVTNELSNNPDDLNNAIKIKEQCDSEKRNWLFNLLQHQTLYQILLFNLIHSMPAIECNGFGGNGDKFSEMMFT